MYGSQWHDCSRSHWVESSERQVFQTAIWTSGQTETTSKHCTNLTVNILYSLSRQDRPHPETLHHVWSSAHTTSPLVLFPHRSLCCARYCAGVCLFCCFFY